MSESCLVIMPILILLQGVVYLWLSIWGLALRECSKRITDVAKQPFQYIMDLIYFYDEACGNQSVLIPTSRAPALLNFTKPADTMENPTFVFLICYVIISTMWILASLWSIVTSSCGAFGRLGILSFGTWCALVVAGSALDAVATGYNVYSLVHTTSAKKTFEFFGIETSTVVMNYIQDFDEYFLAPSVVMICISSRIVLIWLLNLSGSSYCLSILLANRKANASSQATSANQEEVGF